MDVFLKHLITAREINMHGTMVDIMNPVQHRTRRVHGQPLVSLWSR